CRRSGVDLQPPALRARSFALAVRAEVDLGLEECLSAGMRWMRRHGSLRRILPVGHAHSQRAHSRDPHGGRSHRLRPQTSLVVAAMVVAIASMPLPAKGHSRRAFAESASYD